MSSLQNPVPKPSQSASSSNTQSGAQADPLSESQPLAGTTMDQHSASTLTMDSSIASTSPAVTLSPDSTPTDSISPAPEDGANSPRQQPIPPASEPMQYRAIGLIRGKYEPSEEQFTRGTLTTDDGTVIGAVLLGRVMSLVKKHLNLEESHLWVVYPRTRNNSDDLHAQIVGVWEPEKLNKIEISAQELTEQEQEPINEPVEEPIGEPTEDEPPEDAIGLDHASDSSQPEDDYFSIRGEVLFHAPDQEEVVVKIQQAPRKSDDDRIKAFKLVLKGTLAGKAVGYFWDLHVKRQGNQLVIQEGNMIALVPPKKRKSRNNFNKRRGAKGGPPSKKRWSGPSRDGQSQAPAGDRPNVPAPTARKGPISKPIKRPKNGSSPSNPD
jgi:hypothetical protein